jgi:hypothetical protein
LNATIIKEPQKELAVFYRAKQAQANRKALIRFVVLAAWRLFPALPRCGDAYSK